VSLSGLGYSPRIIRFIGHLSGVKVLYGWFLTGSENGGVLRLNERCGALVEAVYITISYLLCSYDERTCSAEGSGFGHHCHLL